MTYPTPTLTKMTHGSLFSGIGGFDLAAEWMGWENVFHCEISEFCNKILKYYWPNAKSYTDIKETDFNVWRGKIDIVTGGFPCQPYSGAGKRKGKEDDRHLWPQMLRAIREIQPRWVIGENVSGLLNWNKGLVLDEIKADLEITGFKVVPPLVLPACSVNAPHRRDRVWIVAYNNSIGQPNRYAKSISNQQGFNNGSDSKGELANPKSRRLEGFRGFRTIEETKRNIGSVRPNERNSVNYAAYSNNGSRSQDRVQTRWEKSKMQTWSEFPTQSPICSRDDGIPGELAGITIPKHRNESIKGYGNAIVPQVVYEIFKTIEKYENLFP